MIVSDEEDEDILDEVDGTQAVDTDGLLFD